MSFETANFFVCPRISACTCYKWYSKQRKLFQWPPWAFQKNAVSPLCSIYSNFPAFLLSTKQKSAEKRFGSGAKSSSRAGARAALSNDNTSHQVLYFSSKHPSIPNVDSPTPFFTIAARAEIEKRKRSQLKHMRTVIHLLASSSFFWSSRQQHCFSGQKSQGNRRRPKKLVLVKL